jgi:hypothetical protein
LFLSYWILQLYVSSLPQEVAEAVDGKSFLIPHELELLGPTSDSACAGRKADHIIRSEALKLEHLPIGKGGDGWVREFWEGGEAKGLV